MPLITEHVALARNGANDKVICRMASGWAVMGDVHELRNSGQLGTGVALPYFPALRLGAGGQTQYAGVVLRVENCATLR